MYWRRNNMNIEKVTFLLKQVRYQEVVVDEDGGFDMPKDGLELVALVGDIKDSPLEFAHDGEWKDESLEVIDLDIIEDLV